MINVGPRTKQHVDLYWNDLFAVLKSSIELFTKNTQRKYARQVIFNKIEDQKNFDDLLVKYLYAVVTETSKAHLQSLLGGKYAMFLEALAEYGFP